jgi:hypothetical protein
MLFGSPSFLLFIPSPPAFPSKGGLWEKMIDFSPFSSSAVKKSVAGKYLRLTTQAAAHSLFIMGPRNLTCSSAPHHHPHLSRTMRLASFYAGIISVVNRASKAKLWLPDGAVKCSNSCLNPQR